MWANLFIIAGLLWGTSLLGYALWWAFATIRVNLARIVMRDQWKQYSEQSGVNQWPFSDGMGV